MFIVVNLQEEIVDVSIIPYVRNKFNQLEIPDNMAFGDITVEMYEVAELPIDFKVGKYNYSPSTQSFYLAPHYTYSATEQARRGGKKSFKQE